MPDICFDGNPAGSWEDVARETVLGPFAPRSGWGWKQRQMKKAEIDPRRIFKRQPSEQWGATTRVKVGYAAQNTCIGKIMKKKEKVEQQLFQESARQEQQDAEKQQIKLAKRQKLFRGTLWQICQGSRVDVDWLDVVWKCSSVVGSQAEGRVVSDLGHRLRGPTSMPLVRAWR